MNVSCVMCFIQAMPSCMAFQTSPLEQEDHPLIMFESTTSGDGDGEIQSEGEGEEGDTPKVRLTTNRRVDKRPTHYPHRERKNLRDQCMKQSIGDHVDEMIAPIIIQKLHKRLIMLEKRLLICWIKSLRIGPKKGGVNTTMPCTSLKKRNIVISLLL